MRRKLMNGLSVLGALAFLLGFVVMFCGGCAIRVGKRGLSAAPVPPPKNAAVRITVRSIGINVGQNPATQQPQLQVGYQSATYDRIPTSVGTNIFIAPVKAGIGVQAGGFAAGITETIEAGTK